MMTLPHLTELLGWASVINISYLLLATIILMTMRGPIAAIHSRMLDLNDKELGPLYFTFLGNYKIFTLIFMVAPYLALKIMGY